MIRYYFSGTGHAVARYAISNNEIGAALDHYHLSGFSHEKILESKNYKEYQRTHPDKTPFDYFAEEKMGFSKRHHVTPFPPTHKKMYFAESSLDLAIRAVENALSDSGTHAADIGAWFLSTVSPHEQAPGMAATLKAYLVPFENSTPTFTLASGCAGFNINLERACEYMDQHPEVSNVVIVHSETMSAFLANRIKFVPFVTFGDGAAAVILTRKLEDSRGGLLNVVNYHDVSMVDFVGVDKKWNLYMDDSVIKDRAVENIPVAAIEALKNTGWSVDDVDIFIPHQTGNAILLPVAGKLGIAPDKVFMEEQFEFGNTSGATVPISLSMLREQNRLYPGTRILSAMAGVGGNYGAFTYEVPQHKNNISLTPARDFVGTKVLLLGAGNAVSREASRLLVQRGADLTAALFGETTDWKRTIKETGLRCINLNRAGAVESLLAEIDAGTEHYDFLLVEPGRYSNNYANNFDIPLKIIKAIAKQKARAMVVVGSITETTGFPGHELMVASVKALHGALASASGEFLSAGIRIVYYMPGFAENDFLDNVDDNARFRIMIHSGQERLLKSDELAHRIVKSLIIPKVAGTWSYYENAMVVRCDGYKPEVDI